MASNLVEIFKHTFGFRTHLADPAFVTSADDFTEHSLSARNIDVIQSKIHDNEAFHEPSYYGSIVKDVNMTREHSTSHVSVLAPNGDAVSVTSTINWPFAMGVVSQSTSVILNNQLQDFTFRGLY